MSQNKKNYEKLLWTIVYEQIGSCTRTRQIPRSCPRIIQPTKI
jgi:hypothetical protein